MIFRSARRGLSYTRGVADRRPFPFPGNELEAWAITAATERVCRNTIDRGSKIFAAPDGDHCTYTSLGNMLTMCAAHRMLLDESTVGRLVFYRRIVATLWTEELHTGAPRS